MPTDRTYFFLAMIVETKNFFTPNSFCAKMYERATIRTARKRNFL